jgi:glutathione S-transferase
MTAPRSGKSNGLLVYLAQTRARLLPMERHGLGLALQWLGWQATDLNFAWKLVQGLQRAGAAPDDPALVEAVSGWRAKMAILEAQLGKGAPFIAGTEFSIADIALGLSCHRWFKSSIVRPRPCGGQGLLRPAARSGGRGAVDVGRLYLRQKTRRIAPAGLIDPQVPAGRRQPSR